MARLSRREFVAQAGAAAISLGDLWAEPQRASAAAAIVSTPLGRIRGEVDGGVRIFRGVPFAQPPVGAARFLPPRPVQPWSGVKDATQFAAAAIQQPGNYRQSEDCLYLNLWAPEGSGAFPVFVYIHGGGFTGGRAFDPLFDGRIFAREGILCITVAYRLGVLGFLDVGSLLGEQYAGSANNALRDLICALEWVQRNVAAFGGDPRRVTIGGESAGAKLTDLLMGIPSARGLFQQMISESGGAERIWPKKTSDVVAQGYGELWTKETGEPVAQMRSAAPEQLIAVQADFMKSWPQHFPLRAEVDGRLIERLPIQQIADGSSRGKHLLIGTNRDESALFVGPHPAADATAADLGNMPVAEFAPIYARYREIYPEMDAEHQRIRALTAEEYWIPSIRVADAHVKAGGKAWVYRLDFAETSGRMAGYAFHSLDNGLVWDRPHADIANATAEAALAKQVHAAWARFIRQGEPGADGLPAWPEYTAKGGDTIILDVQSRVERHPQAAEEELWGELR